MSQPSTSSLESPSIKAVLQIIPGPSLQDAFNRPSGLYVDAKRGMFLVADRGNHRLVLFDQTGRCRGSISFAADSPGQEAGEPLSVAADSDGRLFVVDALDSKVSVLTSRGSQLASLALPVPEDSGTRPQAVEIGPTGLIYLLCGGPYSGVVVLERGGRRVEGLGITPGTEPLGSAVSLAVNEAAGLMAVILPRAEKQVRVYGLDGRLRAEFGAHGEGEGTLSLANHVAWGPVNTLWITDTLRHSIDVYDLEGHSLGRIGGFGREPGQFCFPVACGFLSDDRLIVLERGNARCQILEVHLTTPEHRSNDLTDSVPLTAGGSTSIGGDSQ